jgi:zinc protease
VQATLTLRFGDENSLAGQSAVAQMVGSLLNRGTKNKNRQQLQAEMQKLDAQINVSGGLANASATISTVAENLIPAMRLALECCVNRHFRNRTSTRFERSASRRSIGAGPSLERWFRRGCKAT